MTPLLSILVPTLACRDEFFAKLQACLLPQLGDEVVLLKLRDDGKETIGAKRQRLLEGASTPYVAFVDDDDLVSPQYCSRIVEALKTKPDVVGFRLLQFDNGHFAAQSIHSVTSGRWYTDVETGVHYRTPNHLNPIRRKLALSVGFRDDMNFGEDADYSIRLFEKHPKMREFFINDDLYFYYRRTERNERCYPNP